MKTVTIHDAKTNLSKYIVAAKKGEKIYIGSRGKPEVKLVFVEPGEIEKPKRKFGHLAHLGITAEEIDAIDSSKEWQEIINIMNNKPLL
ncbi:MAG: type II toxin-antitoxin system prevent-host-death family antitoxin [Patescibacteria group bacterium]